jgi:hypothetical protein
MDSSIISGLIGGLASIVICTYLSKKVRKAKVEGELRFGTAIAVLAWCCLSFVGLAVWAFFYDADSWEKPSELYSIIGLFVGFGIGAWYSFGEYFKVRGTFDENGIDFYTPWTGRKLESWQDLQTIKFNSQANWYVLTFKSGKKVRLSGLLTGHGDVIALLKKKGFEF